ncbi:MAG: 50S ribosomal protein L23 [bacterium]|nr:50S ribosomal protein L23 [bacterium]
MALSLSHNDILLSPHVTEKSVRASARAGERVYTFKVHAQTNKQEVKKAIASVYGVTPIAVNMVKIPAKKVRRGRKVGSKSGYKKALVMLKKGETIEFV